jgi:putative peptidoglycan lipid II flippase
VRVNVGWRENHKDTKTQRLFVIFVFFVVKLKKLALRVVRLEEASSSSIEAEIESVGQLPEQVKRTTLSSSRSGAYLVAAGIFLSRIAGLVRERVFAHYFGNSDSADAFKAALRIPNFLQNLFGEGVLSASFIPVYAGLLAREREEEAGKVAGVIATLLGLVTSTLVLLGILTTPFIIDIVAPGFEGEKRQLTIRLVQIFFPGTGLLVMSAWCLGILNSHRRFFLSYVAPVIWNVAIIAALIYYGGSTSQQELTKYVAWGAVLGSALQFGVQLPTARSLIKQLRLSLDINMEPVRAVIRSFVPVVIGRGVVQISAYVDGALASLLSSGAVSALTYAQTIYLLPVSLFGMSVSAAELPEMSSALGSKEEIADFLSKKLDAGLRQIAFFVVPSAIGFLALGDIIVGALYQSGRFARGDTLYVWAVLAGLSTGLLATTLGRLYASTFYAMQDTKTPLRFAIVRVCMGVLLAYLLAFKLRALLQIDASWGIAGLTLASSMAAWIEFSLLRYSLNRRIGRTGLKMDYSLKLWGAALAGAAIAWGVKIIIGRHNPVIAAGLVLAPYGLVYFAVTSALGLPEARNVLRRFLPGRK